MEGKLTYCSIDPMVEWMNNKVNVLSQLARIAIVSLGLTVIYELVCSYRFPFVFKRPLKIVQHSHTKENSGAQILKPNNEY